MATKKKKETVRYTFWIEEKHYKEVVIDAENEDDAYSELELGNYDTLKHEFNYDILDIDVEEDE